MTRIALAALLIWCLLSIPARTEETGKVAWPQFRGPGGRAVSTEEKPLPVEFGPSTNVLWKTPLPAGLSSPCIWGNRIIVTGYDKATEKLETICLDRSSGRN